MATNFAFTPLPPPRSDARRPAVVAALSGTWRGEMIDEKGQRESFTLLRDGSIDAAVVGRFLFFATRDVAPTGVKLLEASEATFAALIGPYFDPRENAEVMTVFEGIRRDNVIEGTFYTRVQTWRDTVRQGRFLAKRADTSHRAA
jgi:hypothetical protein